MTEQSTIETGVLIVGGGPTGLAASILLSRQGVGSILVERRPTTSTMPRARGVHRRTMEILRVCGVAEELYAAQFPLRPERIWSATLGGAVERREPITAGEDDGSLSPERICGCAQDMLEPILRDYAAAQPEGDVRFGVRLESFAQDADGVNATVVDVSTGATTSVRAAFLIAADGPASTVRDACGIAMEGAGHLSDKLNLLIRADVREWVDEPPPLLHIVTGPVKGTFVANGPNGRFQFDVDLEPGMWSEHSSLDDAAHLVRAAVGVADLDLEVLGALPWKTAAQVAERYRAGRVFLAGDAAHRLTPMGGMGISTGIHDVHNLAWKLALVLRGIAGDTLLDTYDAERRPIGLWNVDYSLRMLNGQSGGDQLTDADLGQVYASSAVLPEDDQRPAEGPTGLADVRPGVRAPHLWITKPEGRASTIDLFDRDFVLLTASQASTIREPDTQATTRRPPLRTIAIEDPGWRAAYGVEADGAVLVRPDGVIAWRGRTVPAEPAKLLEAVLGRE